MENNAGVRNRQKQDIKAELEQNVMQGYKAELEQSIILEWKGMMRI